MRQNGQPDKQPAIVVVGVPGAGKTTYCKATKCLFGQTVTYVSSGELKTTILNDLGIKKSLHALNDVESMLLAALFFTKISNPEHGILLFDTHVTYMLPDHSFVNLLPPPAVISNLRFVYLALFECDAAIIRNRRLQRGRKRDGIDLSLIDLEIAMEHSRAVAYATAHGIPYGIIDSSDGMADTADRFISCASEALARPGMAPIH